MKATVNLKLKKPEGIDVIDVNDFNYNFDIIDKKLQEDEKFLSDTYLLADGADLQAREAYEKAEEAFQFASNGKKVIANAVTGKGVQADSNDTFQNLANKINQISTGTNTNDANAVANQILNGSTAYVKGSKIIGTMPRMNSVENNPGGTSIINADGIRLNSSFLEFGIPKYQYSDNNGWNRKPLSEVANTIGLTPDKIVSGNNICGINGTGAKLSGTLTHKIDTEIKNNQIKFNFPPCGIQYEASVRLYGDSQGKEDRTYSFYYYIRYDLGVDVAIGQDSNNKVYGSDMLIEASNSSFTIKLPSRNSWYNTANARIYDLPL